MARIATIAALAAAATLLGACSADGGRVGVGYSNRSLYSVNQPVVSRSEYVFEVPATAKGVPAPHREQLDAWFDSLELGYGDHVFVDGNEADSRARSDVAKVAAEYGLLLSDGPPITPGAVPPGTLRVIVTRSTATVPDCPNWEAAQGPSSTSSNFGCAMNSNLAAMVADPSDLVLGQEGSGTDNRTASKAIKVYRDAPPTGTRGLTEIRTR